MEIGNITDYLMVMVRVFGIYAVITLVLTYFGQKDIGDISLQDLVLMMLISETAQQAMIGKQDDFLGGVVAFLALILSNKIFNYIFYKFPSLRRMVHRKPVFLINHGVIDDKALKRLHMTREELFEVMRSKGDMSASEVKYGILESDGAISLIEYEKKDRDSKISEKIV